MAPIQVDLMDALKKDYHEKLDCWTEDEGDFYDFWKLYENSTLWWHGRFRLIDLSDANRLELLNVIKEAMESENESEFHIYFPTTLDEMIGYYGQRKLEKDPYFKTTFEEKFPYVSEH